jgi:hypothetical protein
MHGEQQQDGAAWRLPAIVVLMSMSAAGLLHCMP